MSLESLAWEGVSPIDVEAIVRGRHGDPFSVLGMHGGDGTRVHVSVFAPQAGEVSVCEARGDRAVAKLERIDPQGFFSGYIAGRTERFPYRLRIGSGSESWDMEDPYRFPPVLGEVDEYLLGEGRHRQLHTRLGAHPATLEGVSGFSFVVWAPNARRVSVVGDFNAWDGRRHPMRRRVGAGLWELFIPGTEPGATYKYELLGPSGERLPLKADPVSFQQEPPPSTASIATGPPEIAWRDDAWMAKRASKQDVSAPISIYEVHLGSWRKGPDNRNLSYDELAEDLAEYVERMGFTHVEFMPVTEHPFTGSWGYQPIGLFAPTARFGDAEAFGRLVDRLHRAGIGVILDWVPAHFPSDAHGLAQFDGTALYEHADPRQGFHRDWNTLIYNFGRREVANFLESSALYWIDRYHVDGLRVDAVASMLYLDYSRDAGEWVPNRHGGNENLEAMDFVRESNALIADYPGTMTVAEESTAFPKVSRPIEDGGLGFNFKWNMGWMHDTLEYFQQDPIIRKYHQDKLTFGLLYAFTENFVLPLSHDEVVHGKGSLIRRMTGDRWQKFANLRTYFGFMWTHPGKKLLFMGGEFAQDREWDHDQSLDWHLLEDPLHSGMQALVAELNRLYRSWPALHRHDCNSRGFEWIDADDAEQSVIAFLRKGDDDDPPVLVMCNLTPVVRSDYRVGVPFGGAWHEILNTDADKYGGSGVGNDGHLNAENVEWHDRPASLRLTLPPLATIILAAGD